MATQSKPSRYLPALILGTLIVPLGAISAAADPHPNTNGGVNVDQVFQMGNLDDINLFNGALTVTPSWQALKP